MWSIDASFAVHTDMRSHSGFTPTLGKGALISGSKTQSLVSKSSTEAELIGVYDLMTLVEWTRLFFEHQVSGILTAQKSNGNVNASNVGLLGSKNIILHDNTSAMKLEINGKRSSTKRTRHIDIRFFYVTDAIKDKRVNIIYCPTKEMTGDYLTKSYRDDPYL